MNRPTPYAASCALRAALLSIALGVVSMAAAHATIVFGTLTVEPNPPEAAAPLELGLTIDDPVGAPVEDAVVVAQFAPAEGADLDVDAEPLATTDFRETAPGRYAAEVVIPADGVYRVVLRDRTFAQEEAIQIVTMEIGADEPLDPIDFIFPPTATGAGLGTWLVWLVAIPLVAGIVVTILVLRGGRSTAEESSVDAS